MGSQTDQVLALAALTQACKVTAMAARRGFVDHTLLQPLVHSLFDLSPANTESVYGGTQHLRPGLRLFTELLKGTDDSGQSSDILRYQLNLLYLEPQLRKQPKLMERIGHGIEELSQAYPETEGRTDSVCMEKLSDLYQNTVSTLKKRIQVQGEYEHLNQPAIATAVRVALFGGVRAAVLWQQVGGRRWHLLLRRKALLDSANRLLEDGQYG